MPGRSAEKGHKKAYVQGAQLSVRVLVANTLLQRAHGLLGRYGLGSDQVGDIEVQSNVFPVSHRMASEAGLDVR